MSMQLKIPRLPGEVSVKLAQTDRLLGGTIWPAAAVLCHYLVNTADTRPRGDVVDCVEVGAGTGAVGIYAAAALGYSVTLTEYRPTSAAAAAAALVESNSDSDGDDAPKLVKSDRLLNLLQQNVDENRHLFQSTKCPPLVRELDFRDLKTAKQVAASSKTQEGFDLILASDVTYTPSLHQPLADTLAELLAATGRCILSHQERLLNVRGEDYQLLLSVSPRSFEVVAKNTL